MFFEGDINQDRQEKESHLRILVSKIVRNDYSPVELNEFVSFCQRVASSYLKYIHKIRGGIILKDKDGLGFDDLAIDLIAGLFRRDDDGIFMDFQNYFEPLLAKDGDVGLDLEKEVHKLVIKKIKQELPRVFRDRDPEGAKIVRNIDVMVNRLDDLSCYRRSGRVFIFRDKENIGRENFGHNKPKNKWVDLNSKQRELIHEELPVVGYEDLKYFWAMIDEKPKTTGKIIRLLLSKIEEDGRFRPVIPKDVLVVLMRNIVFSQTKVQHQCEGDLREELEINDLEAEKNNLKKSVLLEIENKINSFYVAKGKLQKDKAGLYCQALGELLEDLLFGHPSRELVEQQVGSGNVAIVREGHRSAFTLLKIFIPALTRENYFKQDRNIFEHLLRVTKKKLTEGLIRINKEK